MPLSEKEKRDRVMSAMADDNVKDWSEWKLPNSSKSFDREEFNAHLKENSKEFAHNMAAAVTHVHQ